jgi:hypothetical protein
VFVLEQVLARAEPVQHALGDGRVEQALAGAHRPDGLDEVVAADLLEHVAGGRPLGPSRTSPVGDT